MSKSLMLLVLFLVLIPPATLGQGSHGTNKTSRTAEMALANKTWPAFYAAFGAAVKKRDRAALKGMISPRFSVPVDAPEGGFHSPDDVIKWIDAMKLWGDLSHSLASGSKTWPRFSDRDRPRRCTKDGWYCFEFGTDGLWRLVEQTGD